MADNRRFVDAVPSSFQCGVCLEVMRDPVSGCQEGHCFCLECIKELSNCPMCRAPYDHNSFVKNRPAEDYIQALTVMCKHGPESPAADDEISGVCNAFADIVKINSNPPPRCSWRGPLADLQHHLNTVCLFHPTPCSFAASGCSVTMERRLLPNHERECDYRPCPRDECVQDLPASALPQQMHKAAPLLQCFLCHLEIPRKEWSSHAIHSCPEAKVACEYAAFGCNKQIKRKDAARHAHKHAPYHVSLVAGRLQNMEGKVKRLENKVQQLAEAGGAHITLQLTPRQLKQALPCPPPTAVAVLHSEWYADRDGVSWRLSLQVSTIHPGRVYMYVESDIVPCGRKSMIVSLKTAHLKRKWDEHSLQVWPFVAYADLVSKPKGCSSHGQGLIEFGVKVYDCVDDDE